MLVLGRNPVGSQGYRNNRENTSDISHRAIPKMSRQEVKENPRYLNTQKTENLYKKTLERTPTTLAILRVCVGSHLERTTCMPAAVGIRMEDNLED